MFWPFSSKKKEQLPKLVFKPGEAFLEHQCKFGHTELHPGQGLVAYVVDAVAEFGAPVAVKRQPDGRQSAMLKVASEDGGFFVISYTATEKGDDLKAGDYVIWVPVKYEMPKVDAVDGIDPRLGWVGFIVAKLKAEIDMGGSSEFTLLCRYD